LGTTSYAPDIDRIVISGDGSAFPPQSITYKAENATLQSGAGYFYCEYCSGAGKAGFIGGVSGNNVLFSSVTVQVTGIYDMEINYLTRGRARLYKHEWRPRYRAGLERQQI
jgi:hypothetical protein